MSESVRDVVVRVSVQGGKIGKLPDFEKLTTAADAFFRTVDSGMRILQNDATEAATATARLTQDLKEAASIDLGDLGLGEARAAVEELAAANVSVADSVEVAAEKQVEASAAIETATQQEGKSAAESAFKKIALAERLAAHQRKTAEEVLKEEKKKQEAFQRSGEEQQKQMFAASGAIAQALAAGTQFVSTIKLIAGESPEIEELAKQFAQVQGVVQGIAAGTQAFNSINQGLSSLQAASAAATAQLTATGGAATFTQGALIRLAPAAATAQAALGPIAIAISGIALAIATVKAASDYFSEELPDDSERNARQFSKVNEQLDIMKRRIDANARSMSAQNSLLRSELELRKSLAGKETGADIKEGVGIAVKTATDDANAKIESERIAAAKRMAALQNRRRELANENEALVNQDQSQRGLWGGDGKDTKREERKREISKELEALTPQILKEAEGAEKIGVPLTATTMSEFAAAIEKLPEEQRSAYESVLENFENSLGQSLQSATSDLESALRDNQNSVDENIRAQQEATKAFEAEQNIALRLQGSKEERDKLSGEVNAATSTGNLNAGIDALSGVVSTEREQQLRNQLAEGNLTREKLLAEIADAAEFETEKAELEKQVATLKQQADAIKATREELTASQNQVKEQMRLLHEEIRETQQAQQAR